MKLCAYVIVIGIVVSSQAYASSQDHAFSVKDDIAMVRFSDPTSDPDTPGSNEARRSPDGNYIAVVTTKGLLESDRIESDVSVFRLKEVSDYLKGAEQAPKRRVVATIVSFPHREQTMAYAPVIKDLRWSPDMTSVYFRGESVQGAYQLYTAKLDGSGFHALTPSNQSVDRYDVVTGTIAYKASELGAEQGPSSDRINADARAVTGERIQDILFRDQLHTVQPETFTIWVLHRKGKQWARRRISDNSFRDFTYLSGFFPFAISPTGTKLIAIAPIVSVPDSWKQYEPATGFDHLRLLGRDPRLTNADNVLRPQQYSLIDLATGRSVPLMDAPNARSLAYSLDDNRITWAADEQRVLVTNTFLRFDRSDGNGPSQRTRPCAVTSVDLPSLQPQCLFFEEKELEPNSLHVLDASFGTNDNEATVLLKHGPQEQVVQRYQFHDGDWHLASSRAETVNSEDPSNRAGSAHPALTVSVRQSLNETPTLWASNSETGKARQIWNPNPQFSHIRFGEASMYHWHDKTGSEWSGILIKPIDYVSGQRYPLVVQMYSFVEGQFMTDGLYPTAFAARQLASAGFVVLQIKKKPNTLSEADPQTHLEGYRSAVDNLFAAGFVDRKRLVSSGSAGRAGTPSTH
jgi:dipeptidyl aminopeptidase/acylaminoacyl peptidase